MELKIGNRTIDKYNSISVSLRYDSVASSFGMLIYFDPGNAEDRKTFVPGKYSPATLIHNGETLITGLLLTQGFKSSTTKQLMSVGGYSKPGVINDCNINPKYTSNQLDGKSLKEVVNQLIFQFGLNLVVEDIVKTDCNVVFPTIVAESDKSVQDIITTLSNQKNIVLTHDISGNLVLTRAKTDQPPMYNFDGGFPVTNMELNFNGQEMHDTITVVGQSVVGTNNDCESTVQNPYVQKSLNWGLTAFNSTIGTNNIVYGNRPKVAIQTSGDDNSTKLTARQLLSQELKAIRLTISIDRWELNGKLVRPNTIVTVTNPELFLYQKSRWFVESVDLQGDEKSETATLNCVLPECYNNEDVKNVFTGTNLTVPFTDTDGAHAVITPFDQP